MINIMVVEDHLLVRETIVQALSQQTDFQVVASIGCAEQALDYCKQMRIDIVLMDICTAHNASGLTAAELMKQQYPEMKIILMTGLPTVTFIDEARNIGVEGFVYKDISLDDLIQTMRNSMRGYSTFPIPKETSFMSLYKKFTDQEKVILKLMCEGLTRKEIAEELSITENTLKSHLSNIINKSGFASISKLVIHIMNNGFIHPLL